MNFDAKHYVPVLKAKLNEKKALQSIDSALRPHITPLIEIVERNAQKEIDAHLNTAFKDLAAAVDGYPRCMIDAREIYKDKTSAAASVFDRAVDEGMTFTPVTGVSRSVDIAPALDHLENGLAIRLVRQEFEEGIIEHELNRFMSVHGLSPSIVDIIIDLGPVVDLIPAGVARLGLAFLAALPHQSQWRTLTVSACAFPFGMGGMERNSYSLVERSEWQVWRDLFHANQASPQRLPTYSDCAIQHPKGVEGFDFRTMQVSASVRYTVRNQWLLIKGESTRTTPAREQFPELVKQLIYGHLKGHYLGPNHCLGCKDIENAANGVKGLGSPGVWRRIGTIHHLTTVVEDLLSLPSS